MLGTRGALEECRERRYGEIEKRIRGVAWLKVQLLVQSSFLGTGKGISRPGIQ